MIYFKCLNHNVSPTLCRAFMLYSLKRYKHDINQTNKVAGFILETKPNYRCLFVIKKKDVTYFPHVEIEEKRLPFTLKTTSPYVQLFPLFLSLGHGKWGLSESFKTKKTSQHFISQRCTLLPMFFQGLSFVMSVNVLKIFLIFQI